MRILSVSLTVLVFFLVARNACAADPPVPRPAESSLEIEDSRDALLFYFEESELLAATKRPTSLRRVPATATVINAEEIRNMGARDLMDVLRMVPGFGITIDEFGRSMFEVRGISTVGSEKILLMMDGHRLNEAWTGSALANVYNDMPVDNIKRIEVIRGPGSALYGANAFVGVINVMTRDPEDTDGVEIRGTGGSFNTRKVSVMAGKEYKGLKVAGSLDYLNTDGPRLRIERDSMRSPAVSAAPGDTDMHEEKGDFFAKAEYGNWSIMGQYVNKSRGGYIGFNNALHAGDAPKYENYWSEIAYNRAISNDLVVKLRGYFDIFELDSRVGILPAGNTGYPDGAFAKTLLTDRTIGTEMQIDYNLFEGNHLILGATYENIKQYDVRYLANFNIRTLAPLGSLRELSSQTNFNKPASREIVATYLQDEWDLNQELNLIAGVRYDHYSDFGGTVNPRAGIVWAFSDNGEIKLLYGQAFRAPNFKELYDQNNSFSVGNPDLKPENIQTFEGGVGYKFCSAVKANATYFRSNIRDLIDRDTTVTPTRYVNKGKLEVNGVEAELMVMQTLSNYLRLGYVYQDARDEDHDISAPWIPRQRFTAGLNAGITRYLNGHLDLLWTGARGRIAGDTRSELPSYTTVDLTLVARNFYKNLEIVGTVHNLLDHRYRDPDRSGALAKIPGDLPREGISGYLTVAYRF
jgi:iron complex outermembrane receptor protein